MTRKKTTTTALVAPTDPKLQSSALVLSRPEEATEDQSTHQEFSRENSLLDDKIDECRTYLQTSGSSYVAACQCIKDIADGLWEERRGADGRPLYESWKEYARRELAGRLGLKSHTHVFEMLRVIEQGLVPEIEKFGIKMVKLLAAAPPDARNELRARREAGAGTREIEHHVARINNERHERDVAEAKASGERLPRRRGRKSARLTAQQTAEAPAPGEADGHEVRFHLIAEEDGALSALTPELRAGRWRIVVHAEQRVASAKWLGSTAEDGAALLPMVAAGDVLPGTVAADAAAANAAPESLP